jgi:O-antigen/teichoic acid export membrane protein
VSSAAAGGQGARSYGAGARILSIGLALTGVVTLAFFALASHALDDEVAYGRVSLLWAVTFMVTSVIYRPIEQLLARSIAESRARGNMTHALRTPLILQVSAATMFVVVALLLRDVIVGELFGGEEVLFWLLVGAVSTYSLSYFARGWLAGSGRPELYGVLVFIESSARCVFPIVALLGVTHGTFAVAAGIAAAPLISLAVVPLALRGGVAAAADGSPEQWDRTPGDADFQTIEAQAGSPATGAENLTLRAGAVFAGSTVLVMFAEQLLITAGVLAVALDRGGQGVAALGVAAGAAGAVFNAFLVSRAPLQLFQAVQSTLLPHLAALSTSGDHAAAAKALRTTMAVIAGFAGSVTAGLLVLGPWGINLVFNPDWPYAAGTLALIGVGMGLHLAAGTLNQSALAHGRAPLAAAVWAFAAIISVVWLVARPIEEPVARAAAGYVVASGLLFAGLLLVERRSLR